jgi:opacity protein-like surface antigen
MIRHLLFSGMTVIGLGFLGTGASAADVDVNVNTPDARVEIRDDDDVAGQPMIFFSGGGHNSLRDVDPNSDTNFRSGYNFGGGLGIQLSRSVALRGVYTFSRSEGRSGTFSPISNNDFDRHYYGADLQLRAMNDSGFTPYIFGGGGAVTVRPDSGAVITSPLGVRFSNNSWTKPAARFGLGFEYQIPDTGFGLFAEGSGWAYEWDRYGFDETQVDATWGGGLTYRFGY